MVTAFDEHWSFAMTQDRDEYALTPLRAFVAHWWSWVAVARYPERRAAEAEIAAILADAEPLPLTGPGTTSPTPNTLSTT